MRDGKREILVGAVGLVKGSVRNGGKAMVAICDEFEPVFERTCFLNDAPFKAISVVLSFGTKWGEPDLGKINKRHAELEVSIELPMYEIRMMDEASLASVFRKAVLEALVAIAQKYDLDGGVWKAQLEKSDNP